MIHHQPAEYPAIAKIYTSSTATQPTSTFQSQSQVWTECYLQLTGLCFPPTSLPLLCFWLLDEPPAQHARSHKVLTSPVSLSNNLIKQTHTPNCIRFFFLVNILFIDRCAQSENPFFQLSNSDNIFQQLASIKESKSWGSVKCSCFY